MPELIKKPFIVPAVGNKPKKIEEYVGKASTHQDNVSVALMRSPEGWEEPGQRPDFEEITLVLRGVLKVEFEGGALHVNEGQAVVAKPGEWVRYSTPSEGGAKYISVCIPAFSPDTVHRD